MLRATRCIALSLAFVATTATAFAAEPAKKDSNTGTQATASADAKRADAPAGDMVLSGLSIVGNDESPKELVIVPWKSSQLADAPGISRLLDDSTQPVDKDVFLRELAFYGLQTAAPEGD